MVRQLASQTPQFRILALSATPGGDTKAGTNFYFSPLPGVQCSLHLSTASPKISLRLSSPAPSLQSVQSVISNLLISHIELRLDESPDIRAHSHQRNVEKVVVPLGAALSAYQARYVQVGTSKSASCSVSWD